MKFNKVILGLICASSLILTSCYDEKGDDYTPASPESGAYLYTDASSIVFAADDEQVLTISVGRTETSEPLTVNLSSNNTIFNTPSSVSFAAGEGTKQVQIPFNMAGGTTEQVTFTINEGTTAYGPSTVTLNVTRDYVWATIGTGQWLDGFWYGFWSNVTIQQREDNPSVFRVTNPYIDSIVLADGSSVGTYTDYLTFTLKEDGTVTWDGYFYINTLYDVGQEIKAYLPSALSASVADADALSYAETDEDGSILFFQIAPYWYVDGAGGWGTDYPCYLAFPGVDLATAWEW